MAARPVIIDAVMRLTHVIIDDDTSIRAASKEGGKMVCEIERGDENNDTTIIFYENAELSHNNL